MTEQDLTTKLHAQNHAGDGSRCGSMGAWHFDPHAVDCPACLPLLLRDLETQSTIAATLRQIGEDLGYKIENPLREIRERVREIDLQEGTPAP